MAHLLESEKKYMSAELLQLVPAIKRKLFHPIIIPLLCTRWLIVLTTILKVFYFILAILELVPLNYCISSRRCFVVTTAFIFLWLVVFPVFVFGIFTPPYGDRTKLSFFFVVFKAIVSYIVASSMYSHTATPFEVVMFDSV